MAIFQMKWLRKLVRRSTNPIPLRKASSWKERLSIAYMLLAWNAFGMVMYMFYTGRGDWAKYYGLKSEEESRMSPARSYAKILGIEKATVIQLSGFTKKAAFEVDNTLINDTDTIPTTTSDNAKV